jgi:uncharacterized protein
MSDAARVVHEPEASRWVIPGDGETAELVYRRRGDRLVLVHTGVPADMGGHGLGGRLVETAVRYAAAEGLTVVPLCPFARDWLERHPDAAATVSVDWGA